MRCVVIGVLWIGVMFVGVDGVLIEFEFWCDFF